MHYTMLIETDRCPLPEDIENIMYPFMEYNEDAEHPIADYYVLGGRWSGDIPDNCCIGSDVSEDFFPYYFVTSDGTLYANGYNWATFPNSPWSENDGIFCMPSAFVGAYERSISDLIDHQALIDKKLFERHYRIDASKWYTLLDIHG